VCGGGYQIQQAGNLNERHWNRAHAWGTRKENVT